MFKKSIFPGLATKNRGNPLTCSFLKGAREGFILTTEEDRSEFKYFGGFYIKYKFT